MDNCRATQIEGLTDEYTSLESLSLINVGLTSLKGFPKLPDLKRLELSDNRIHNGLAVLQGSPAITHLNISGNKIKEFDVLEPLKSLENLTHLDLFNNPLGDEDDFRKRVFDLLPNLKYLDSADINNEEADESDLEDGGANGAVDGEDEEDDGEDDLGTDFIILALCLQTQRVSGDGIQLKGIGLKLEGS